MEILKPINISLALGVAGSLAYDALISPAEAAGPCKSLATRVVREFEDIGGVKDQYDSVIDRALGVIPGARVRYLVGGQIFEVTTDNRGYSERMIEAPCVNGNRIVASSEVTTPDGRRVEDEVILQNGRKENFRTWVVKKAQTTSIPSYFSAERSSNNGDFWKSLIGYWWVLPVAALAGVGTWALIARRRHH